MKKMLCLAVFVMFLVGVAAADSFVPITVTNAQVQIWTFNMTPAQQQAQLGTLALFPLTPTYDFKYTGQIDFLNPCGFGLACNDFGTFFGHAGGTITNFAGATSLADFQAAQMSARNQTNGNFDNFGSGLASFILITFNSDLSGPGSVIHDDGVSIYGPGGILLSSPALTSADQQFFNWAGGPGTFKLAYVEANSGPGQLTVSAVPEPSSLLLLGSGLLSAAGVFKRKLFS